MSAKPEVIVRVEGGVGRLTLNRPAALHALTTGMCAAMIEALLAWRDDPAVALVLIDHAGERGFCAGGDIRMLAESGAGDGAAAREFFFVEYRLNDLLFTLSQAGRRHHGRRHHGRRRRHLHAGALSAWRPSARPSPCRRRASASSPTSAAAGTCRAAEPCRHVAGADRRAHPKAADCLALGIATDFVESAKLRR